MNCLSRWGEGAGVSGSEEGSLERVKSTKEELLDWKIQYLTEAGGGDAMLLCSAENLVFLSHDIMKSLNLLPNKLRQTFYHRLPDIDLMFHALF